MLQALLHPADCLLLTSYFLRTEQPSTKPRRNAGRRQDPPATQSVEFRPKHTKHKVLLAVYGALFLLCIGVIAFVHQGEQRARQVQGLSQLESITATLSEQIPHGHITALMERYDGRGMIFKNTQDAWYYVLHERLRKAAERNGLEAPLEILVHDTMKQELQVRSDLGRNTSIP